MRSKGLPPGICFFLCFRNYRLRSRHKTDTPSENLFRQMSHFNYSFALYKSLQDDIKIKIHDLYFAITFYHFKAKMSSALQQISACQLYVINNSLYPVGIRKCLNILFSEVYRHFVIHDHCKMSCFPVKFDGFHFAKFL